MLFEERGGMGDDEERDDDGGSEAEGDTDAVVDAEKTVVDDEDARGFERGLRRDLE